MSNESTIRQDVDSKNPHSDGRTLWVEQSDPTSTGLRIDHEYLLTETRNESATNCWSCRKVL